MLSVRNPERLPAAEEGSQREPHGGGGHQRAVGRSHQQTLCILQDIPARAALQITGCRSNSCPDQAGELNQIAFTLWHVSLYLWDGGRRYSFRARAKTGLR